MKIARVRTGDNDAQFAVQRDDTRWVPLADLDIEAATTADVIDQRDRIEEAARAADGGHAEPALLCPVVRPSKVLAIGLNYLDHIREAGLRKPDRPVLFAKFPSALNDPSGDVVVDPSLTEEADYEVELAVVIGERTHKVSEEEALSRVFGYAVANDVSARDGQRADGQFSRSKSFDTFCPIGPWITTADEVGDPQTLGLRSWVNDEPRQDSSTRQMLFSVAHLVHYLSRGMTLEAGDVILTGTPHGVGFAIDPPRFLTTGDVVECEVEGLGRLRNRIVGPPPA